MHAQTEAIPVGKYYAPLVKLLNPQRIAVIGATENTGTVGRTVFWNLISSPFGGTVFPVNLKRSSVLGVKAYPDVAALPEPVDLAVICTPAPTVPDIIRQCGKCGIPGAVIISAGFRELGPPGVELERRVAAAAAEFRMRLIGPNCLGVQIPITGLNASFARGIARPGSIAMISQSGALLTAILDWSIRAQVGLSACVSLGSMLDVGFGDMIDYLGDDPHTRAILIYMEGVGNPQQFMSAAREVALSKPIIVIKAGRTAAAAAAAASHTGSMTGSDDVLDAVFQRVGVQRVSTIRELFDLAEILATQPRPKGPNLTILTNAGGPGVLTTDALIQDGGRLTHLSAQTMTSLDALLPPHWSHGNPVDILGDASPDRYARALEIISKDEGSDGMLVILTPQDMTDPTRSADALVEVAKQQTKPILASWMGGTTVQAGKEILNRAGIPTFSSPDAAARAFNYLWQYSRALKALYETPRLPKPDQSRLSRRERAAAAIDAVLNDDRTIMSESEAKDLLSIYGVPVNTTRVAQTVSEAVEWASQLGFPVVLKLHSHTITHKTDVGGVALNLTTSHDVEQAFERIRTSITRHGGESHFQGVSVQPMVKLTDAYELIVGSAIDPQFGPVILFGGGGQMVELIRDRSLGLPPLNSTLARQLISRTRISRALAGIRGRRPVDIARLEELLVTFSHLIVEHPRIQEVDINPLLAGPDGIVALDARVILFPKSMTESQLPRPAIRPYPDQYVRSIGTKDGTRLVLRPICPEDEPLMVDFHRALSTQSVRNRYYMAMRLEDRIAHERLVRICMGDYAREMAMVAESAHADGPPVIVGVGRLSKIRGTNAAEVAAIVSDAWQHQGVGKALLAAMIDIARREGIARVFAKALVDNFEARHVLVEHLGFRMQPAEAGSPTIHFDLDIASDRS